jgi:hypothetical protein
MTIMLTTAAAAAAAANKLFQIINLLSNIQIYSVFFNMSKDKYLHAAECFRGRG